MSATLAAWVHMPDSDGTTVSFGPGSTPPEWAARQITNPKAWTDGQVPNFNDEPVPEPVPESEPEPENPEPDENNQDRQEPEPVEPAPAPEPEPDEKPAPKPRQRRTSK